jgi:hypothetical protein
MKTVREWLNELPEEIRERAIRNAKESEWKTTGTKISTIRRALQDGFSWRRSPEGKDFWFVWDYWLLDPTRPKPTIKPSDGSEVVSEHESIKELERMVAKGRAEEITGREILSRRDQFAMAAMQAIITNEGIGGPSYFEKTAEFAVEAADALIQELDKNQDK